MSSQHIIIIIIYVKTKKLFIVKFNTLKIIRIAFKHINIYFDKYYYVYTKYK